MSLSVIRRLLLGDDIRGKGDARTLGRARGEHLRGLLQIGDGSPLLDAAYRNAIEHVDERLDEATAENNNYLVDNAIYFDAGRLIVFEGEDRQTVVAPLRELNVGSGRLTFRGEHQLDLGLLKAALDGLRATVTMRLDMPAPRSEVAYPVFIRVVKESSD